jgi:hypothetical protein
VARSLILQQKARHLVFVFGDAVIVLAFLDVIAVFVGPFIDAMREAYF